MHVRFVHPLVESLAIEYLSAVLKRAGHKTDLVFDSYYGLGFGSRAGSWWVRHEKKMVKRILQGKPDLIAFSVMSSSMEWAYRIAGAVKKSSAVPIVFGGIQPTLIPDKVIAKEFIDYVIVGEGEYALLELVENLQEGREVAAIKNLCFKNNGNAVKNPLRGPIENLDELPFPDKELIPGLNKIREPYSIITGRGCVGSCTYCCAAFIKKLYKQSAKIVRRRSPENVIAELELAKSKYGIKTVIFEDDLFTDDKKWLRSFSEIYEKTIGLPCILCVHPNYVDEEMVRLLKKINCKCVEIGVQSLNEVTRRDVLKRYYSNEHLAKVLRLIKAHRIYCQVDNIIGLPGEREVDVVEMVKFYNEIRPGKIDVFYLQYYPGIEIMDLANLDEAVKESINNGERFSSSVIRPPDELSLARPYWIRHAEKANKEHFRAMDKIVLTVGLIYVLPKRVVDFILQKRLFRFFPSIKNLYNLNGVLFYAGAFFSGNWGGAKFTFRGILFNHLKFLFYHHLQNMRARRDRKH